MENTNDNNKDLYYLNELSDYQVASDYPDVRGWKVEDAQGHVIGKVDDLLVSKQKERVVYLDVEMHDDQLKDNSQLLNTPASDGVHGFVNKEGENHLILPIGLVQLREEEEVVYTSKINQDTFLKAKRFTKRANLNRDDEMIIYKHYFPDTLVDNRTQLDSFYNQDGFVY